MTEFGNQLVLATRTRVGQPFLHHFKPNDECMGGEVTVAHCMERGMDDDGYDCSGLIVAGLCDVLGINTGQWSPDHRHVRQLLPLAEDAPLRRGDLLLFDTVSPTGATQRTHIGIHVEADVAIHSDGMSKRVSEGFVDGEVTQVRMIPLFNVLEAAGIESVQD